MPCGEDGEGTRAKGEWAGMIEMLQFTFQSFWHFVGVLMLLGVVCKTIMVVAVVLLGR